MDAPGGGRETSNATIGTFTANADGSFSGAIRTPASPTGPPASPPATRRSLSRLPGVGRGCGRARGLAEARQGRRRIVDDAGDTGFGEPVNAALAVIGGVRTLVWSRSAAKAGRRPRGATDGASLPS
ncbi:DUF736 domain-containing protein [Caulobacter sp. RHG1]|uniref:DUF736 domain-containing protein n=1 Tax=Caulobacter sp. (strain RHG1) TaxID=2545762 RepID=UPI0015525DB3|nr:DUF736 domain-containing protein [Caulobacter sp. RHG1]NQE65036.1 hypothetical protein [Caulobacter sp. RHG1]